MTPWHSHHSLKISVLFSEENSFIYYALDSFTPKPDGNAPLVSSENIVCSRRSSGASMSVCRTSSWRTLACYILWIYMTSVFFSLVMTPGCLTHLWSTDLQNSHRKVLESWNEAQRRREADRASEPEGFSGWKRTRKGRIISGLGR